MARSLDARKPSKRQQTHGERLAGFARKRGLTVAEVRASPALMQAARGHKGEQAEKKARRATIRQKYGVTPERLSRLRREARLHVAAAIRAAGGRVNELTVRDNLKTAPVETLLALVDKSGGELRLIAGMNTEQLIEFYPDLVMPNEINPAWYH